VRHDDAEARGGFRDERVAHPCGAGSDFGAGIGSGDPLALGNRERLGSIAGDADVAVGEGGEPGALRGRDAIEADEAELGWEGDGGTEGGLGGEVRGDLAGADPAMANALAFEFGSPVAKALRVGKLAAHGPRGAACGMGVERGQQRPGVHGEGGYRFRRDDAPGIVKLHADPERALLKRREQDRRVGMGEREFVVELAKPGIPIEDGWRWPERAAGGALLAGIGELKGAGSARAGSDDSSATLE